MSLVVEGLSVWAGSLELRGFELEVAAGECVALMGPSGCGKTTLVETICGLRETVTTGRITLDGRDVTTVPAWQRRIGLVPQDVVLFPMLKVREQLEFAMSVRKWPRARRRERVEELAEALGLAELLGRRSDRLSGGEARRVALGRALAVKPDLLCLDEALAGLDAQRHAEVLAMVRAFVQRENVTTLLVTHSEREAEDLADRIVQVAPTNAR